MDWRAVGIEARCIMASSLLVPPLQEPARRRCPKQKFGYQDQAEAPERIKETIISVMMN